MIPSRKLTLDLINEHLICHLCSGYLIDAWTINECLHSFCRSCIFSYFNDNDDNTTCPVCSTVPHPANPLLGITKDCWLQQIVYKLVPSLFKREMCQRRIYYDSNPESKIKLIEQYSKTLSSQMGCREEELGELSERCLFQQKHKYNNKENIYITLEYNENDLKDFQPKTSIFFIECSSNMPINILKQYLKKVLPLSKRTRYQIDILYEQKILLDNLILNHIYSWKQNKHEKYKQLHLFYRIIIIEREQNDLLLKSPIKIEQSTTNNILNLKNSSENNTTTTIISKPAPFVRSTNIYNSFVHTTPFTPAEARTISLNNSITEQLHGNETTELIKPKECTLIDCKTFAITTPINYSMNSINEISKTKKRLKKSNINEQSLIKKPKNEKNKKIKEEKSLHSLLPTTNLIIPLNSSPSENENPNEIIEQKQLSYSEIIQEANKLLAADESLTSTNNSSSLLPLTNPITTRLTKPIATVSPLHTSKTNHNRVIDKTDDNQLIDLSKSNITSNDIPLKVETNNIESSDRTKKRSREMSSSTTRTKVSRHSNKSNNDETKSLKKSHSNMHTNQFLSLPPPPTTTSQQQQQQQMFQNLFHSFQNQANYWPMNPWPVPPSLALIADPRNYYTQPWPSPQSTIAHGPKDLSSASLNDFIGKAVTLHPSSTVATNMVDGDGNPIT
ncbi:unnamed protein product, partial [Rotaria sp. Silwood1]